MFKSRSRGPTGSFLSRMPFGVRLSAPLRAERKSSSEGKLPKSRQTVSPLNLRYRLQTAVVAGVTCFTFVAWIPPVLSQASRAGEFRGEGVEREQLYLAQATSEDSSAASSTASPEARTTKDPKIPIDELKLLLKPLTLAQLEVEAAGWMSLLQNKVQDISDAEVAIKRQNRQVKQQEEAVKALEEAKKKFEEAEELQKTAKAGTPEYEEAAEKVEEAKEALEKAQVAVQEASEAKEKIDDDESIKKAVEAAEDKKEEAEGAEEGAEKEEAEAETDEYDEYGEYNEYGEYGEYNEYGETEETEEEDATDEAAKGAEEAVAGLDEGSDGASSAEAVTEKKEQLEAAAEKLEEAKKEDAEIKTQLVVSATELQEEKIAIVDRFETVLDELDNKGGESESYHKYIQAVSGVEIDVTDTQGLGVRLLGWFKSEEGGLRWTINILKFIAIVVACVIIARTLAKYLDSVMSKLGSSELMRNFLVNLVNRGGSFIGVLLGLTALEVSLGPVLTVLGGASFVLAFALQSNLGNLASGLMIMFYKPFDVGDEVKLGGIWGWVDSINLASTKVKGFQGQILSIPNNTVWGGTIENLTGDEIRKGSLTFRVGLHEDIAKVREIILETAKSHPLVLDDPGPGTFVFNYGEDHLPISLSFATKTGDFWTVWGDLTSIMKGRLEEEGIALAVPVQDIRMQSASNGNGTTSSPTNGDSSTQSPSDSRSRAAYGSTYADDMGEVDVPLVTADNAAESGDLDA